MNIDFWFGFCWGLGFGLIIVALIFAIYLQVGKMLKDKLKKKK